MRKMILSLLSLGFVPAVASAHPHFFDFFFHIPVPIVVAPAPVCVAPAPVCVEPAPVVTFIAPAPVRVFAPPQPFFVHRPFWGDRHFHR